MALCYDGGHASPTAGAPRRISWKETRTWRASKEAIPAPVRVRICHCPRLPNWRIHEPHQRPTQDRIVLKLAEVAQRELSKPENQQKIKDGIRKFQEAAKSRR